MIQLRRMTKEDIDFVVENELAFFHTSLGREMIEKDLANEFSYYYIFTDNDIPIGYLSSWVMIPSAEILNFFVINEYQGRGIGDMMLKSIINSYKQLGVESISLEVRVTNQRAISLYEKNGFKKAYIRKQYYHDGTDAILMLKEV